MGCGGLGEKIAKEMRCSGQEENQFVCPRELCSEPANLDLANGATPGPREAGFSALEQWNRDHRSTWERTLDRLDDLLANRIIGVMTKSPAFKRLQQRGIGLFRS